MVDYFNVIYVFIDTSCLITTSSSGFGESGSEYFDEEGDGSEPGPGLHATDIDDVDDRLDELKIDEN